MSERILHQVTLSGHCHKVRLFLSLLGLSFTVKEIDMAAGEHQTSAFLALNPLAQVPVLIDKGLVITDSNAILIYLAQTYASGSHWYPDNTLVQTQIQKYLSLAAGLLAEGAAAARLINVFKAPLDKAACLRKADRLLTYLNQVLSNQNWLAAEQISIADIAHYSYIAHAPEGDVDLTLYPAVQQWLQRIETNSRFVAMPKTFVGLQK
ncbi:glutathione S-transferase family protein [Gayadomonas joobiniege]|uniref:glutathione S-transferase family protein n=1 Tax=Gayadomonas joobiniege TaxID=1234606 RepID=UPI00035DC072|nr:glutathione S-transferase [Gayadomonas joobiniege]